MQLTQLAAALAVGAGALAAQSPNARLPQEGHPEPRPALVRPVKIPASAGGLRILVYDQDTAHGFATEAALALSPSATVVGDALNFNVLLVNEEWDVVAVDCPGFQPMGGWYDLIDYVHAGGAAILSFYDWDNTLPGLLSAFDVKAAGDLSLTSKVLSDNGVAPAFLGVQMPNLDWHDHWNDDGDRFEALDGARKLAYISDPGKPVMVRGNDGRTVAAPLLDEAGTPWVDSGDAVALWENLMLMVSTFGPEILVYDDDSDHHLAQQAAFQASPGGTALAQAENFDARLASQVWDALLLDAPSQTPELGWASLIDYVNADGHAVLAYYDWNGLEPLLPLAFEVAPVGTFSFEDDHLTLFDSGFSGVFDGVTMPNAEWDGTWYDDGDRFDPLGLAKGLAHVGDPQQPVIVWGNGGRTIAAPILDEAGPGWLADGSAVNLWGNLLASVMALEPSCEQRTGTLGLNPPDLFCLTPPLIGGTLVANVYTGPSAGTTTLSTFITLGLGGPTQGAVAFGYELLILPPYLVTTGFGTHSIPVPEDPTLVGLHVASQGARLETGAAGLVFVLTNALDAVIGL